MGTENVCRFFKYGFCKFKLRCRYKHVTKVCDDEKCNQETCQKRHPRICKYYVNFGSCKLGSNCAYAHKIQRKEENGRLEQKLDELARIISGKDDVIRKLESKIDDLIQKNKEKDLVIEKLVRDVKDLTKKKDKPVTKAKSSVSKKKQKETIVKEISEVVKDNTDVLEKEKEQSEKEKEQDNSDKHQVFIKNSLQLLVQTDLKKVDDDDNIKSRYFKLLTEIEKEKERLKVYRLDLITLVAQMRKYFPNKSEFSQNPSEAIPNYVETVKDILKRISNGENVTTAQMFEL